MTIKHQEKNISAENIDIITNVVNNNGILTFTVKNLYDDTTGDPINIDLSEHKLKLRIATSEELTRLKNSTDSQDQKDRERYIYLVSAEDDIDTEGIYEEHIWIDEKNDFEIIGSTRISLTHLLEKNKVIDNLNTATFNNNNPTALSAKQGKVLQDTKQNKTDNSLNTSAKTIVGAINEHESDINSLNTNKVDKSSIADNLTTNDSSKVLSAKQGYILANDKIIEVVEDTIDEFEEEQEEYENALTSLIEEYNRQLDNFSLPNNSVSTSKIVDGAVTSNKITNGTIVNEDISSNASIDFSKLNITANDIIGLGVSGGDTTYSVATTTTDGLMSSNDKQKLDNLDTSNYVTTSDTRLSDTRTPTDNSVSTAKIVNGAITSDKIENGTIVNEDISSNASIDFSKLDITKEDIVGLGIPSTDTNTTYTASTMAGNADTTNGAKGTSNAYARADHTHKKSGLYAEASHTHTKSQITDLTIPDISGKEDVSNKVTSLSSSSTDTQYPTAKCVYDNFENYVFKEYTDWTSVTYEDGYSDYEGDHSLRYRRTGFMVELNGHWTSIGQKDASDSTPIKFASIPVEYAPTRTVRVCSQGSGSNTYLLSIHIDGRVTWARYGAGTSVELPDGVWCAAHAVWSIR